MPHKGPHISISAAFVVNRILRISIDEFESWPTSVQELATRLAEELFLVAYNPFIDPASVRLSVDTCFRQESQALAHHYATSIGEGITMFWSAHEAEENFRKELVTRLKAEIPEACIVTRPGALVEAATDATDLRMELPLLVVEPATAEQASALVRLANEMKFAIIPRGGGSGMTGGAVPGRKRTVIANMTRLTQMMVDEENLTLHAQAGVITQDAIDAAAEYGLLFTVDPASKTASTLGGNIAENSGGPLAFEYGTTLDNLLSWRMVTPTGEIISVERVNHPRHKIFPHESATFEIRDISGGMRNVVELKGDEIRLPGLGKDVTNKVLGGLPGMQKEGVDGIITEAVFVLHKKPAHSRVLMLEFFGRSMHEAAVLIGRIVELRDKIRQDGDYVRVSALEEFNSKYVKAIGYQKKSQIHEGMPISVILVQVDGDDPWLLESCVQEIMALAADVPSVDLALAKDEKEGELFWEDRHKLSAIAKRTSGFKINEDVVVPMHRIPDFALFLEQLNVELAATAYRNALQEIGRLQGMPLEDKEFNREFSYASKAAKGEVTDTQDEELILRADLFLAEIAGKYPPLAAKVEKISQAMRASRVEVASHSHAGDGNCHVNIPVNSNDPAMMEEAEHAASRVMAMAKEMGGAVSGEHGIGITKIRFLEKEKIDALAAFKHRVDPRDILNPGKLVQKELPVQPFTFSFNRLIEDIRQSGLADKERFIHLLSTVQTCTRCGKCKHVCPMVYAEKSYHYHPRNKNIVLGAMMEAIYYSQITKGKISPYLLVELRAMVEHCTGCGRCTSVCPVKIESAEVALGLLAFLKDEGMSGHPIKGRVLHFLANSPASRVPTTAKAAALGQKVQNTFIGFVPQVWRNRLQNPLFTGKGPEMGMTNLYETLKLEKGGIFLPEMEKTHDIGNIPAVLYFPGCGGSLFYRHIAMASIALLTRSGVAVVVPTKLLCCGYPLLCSGAEGDYRENLARNQQVLAETLALAQGLGLNLSHYITACGSCRDSLSRHNLLDIHGNPMPHADAIQLLVERLPLYDDLDETAPQAGQHLLYHASCHPEWSGVKAIKGGGKAARALERLTGAKISISAGCCGESGTGAMSSPHVYNALRERKMTALANTLPLYNPQNPILVGCPSCKIGIQRSLLGLKEQIKNQPPVLHSVEWLAEIRLGKDWFNTFKKEALLLDDKGLRHIQQLH